MNEESRKWLYQNLRMNGLNVGNTYEDFAKLMDTNEQSRRWAYDRARELGYNVGKTYEQFNSLIGPKVQPAAKPAATTTAKPNTTPTVKASTQIGTSTAAKQTASAPASTTAKVEPTVKTGSETSKPQGWKPSPAQQMAFSQQMADMNAQLEQSQRDFHTRMENIRKGNSLGHTSERKFNAKSGKWEQKYYTTTGEEVSTPQEQSRKNLEWRDEWEATTEEGRKNREQRIQQGFENRVGAVMDKFDPDNAAEKAWQLAEQRTKAAIDNRQPSTGNALLDAFGADTSPEASFQNSLDVFVSHLKYHDLQRMADDAWNGLGKEKQQAITSDLYEALHNRYPQATNDQLKQAAAQMARQQSDQRMFELAVEKNAPQSATEYFFRKAIGQNAAATLMMATARAQAGTTGDMESRDIAEERFEKQGHKLSGVLGTVAGFAIDPLTWLSAGIGSGAVKGGLWLGGKKLGEAATRKFTSSLGGRIATGVLGGAANLGSYQAGSEALNQARYGGTVEGVDPETGRYVIGDYSPGNVAKQFGHGFLMGAATGTIAPLLGNVSDKLVRATESTAGKAAIRTGELGVGTLAEGTVFSVPEFVSTYSDYNTLIKSLADPESPNYIADEQEREQKAEQLRQQRGDAMMDVWTDNMAMMAGFKGQHLIKSAPRRIAELASMPKDARGHTVKAGFETRLRKVLDGDRRDLALTKDEKRELQEGGYGDLSELVEGYTQTKDAQTARNNKINEARAKGYSEDIAAKIADAEGGELPYTRFAALMNDARISEAARAKMYYYLTGNVLPMSTVMGSGVEEVKDAKGNVTGYNVQSFGANGVITSRTFDTKKRADMEVNRINRQAELNTIDVGEQYTEEKYDNKRMYEACRRMSGVTGAPANLLFELMKRKPEDMDNVEAKWAEKILSIYDGLGNKSFETIAGVTRGKADSFVGGGAVSVKNYTSILAEVSKEFGVNVDKAIKKEPDRRNEQERKAVKEYMKRLFDGVGVNRSEAGQAKANPDQPQGGGGGIAGLLDMNSGDPTDPTSPDQPQDPQSAAWQRGHEADAQERRDIAIELGKADPDSEDGAQKQEAWSGVVQRINEDAAYLAAQQREQGRQMQHTDGNFHPAVLKEKDADSNDQTVYIVDGEVNMTADGTMVDPDASDHSVVIYDPATGERKMIDPTADTGIMSVGEVTTGDDFEAQIQQQSEQYVQAQIDEAQGTVRVQPGQVITLPTGEQAMLIAIDGNGEDITVRLGDDTQAQVQRSELQRAADEAAQADYNQRHGIEDRQQPEQPEQSNQSNQIIEGAPSAYAAGMELSVRDEGGTEKPAMVMSIGRMEYTGGVMKFVPDPNGNTVEYMQEGEVKHDHIDALSEKVTSYLPPKAPEPEPPLPTTEEDNTKSAPTGISETPEGQTGQETGQISANSSVDKTSETRETRENRIRQWLSEENLNWAEGKTREEIIERFGNTLQPIAVVPEGYLKYLGEDVTDSNVYSGMGYFIDHAVNHHDEEPIEEYLKIQDILDHPDDVKLDTSKGRPTLLFIKKYGKYNVEMISVSEDGEKVVLHKSFFHRKKMPHGNLPSVAKETPSAAERSTISPSPTGEAGSSEISALGGSPAKLGISSQTGQENGQENAPMPMKDDGEEDWLAATPERTHAYIFGGEAGLTRSEGNDFITAQQQAANAALAKAKAAQMPKIGTSIRRYNEAKAKRQQKIDEAQAEVDYWRRVRDIQNEIVRRENEEQAARQSQEHDKAVAQAQAEYEARKQAEAERKAVGNENPMPAITEKWNNAEKIDGVRDEIVLPNGERVKGHYVLHESGASSPSHDPTNWHKTEGFPMDANDNSVNDRDYEHDRDAQQVTEDIAKNYDQRALQTPVVVSQDGVVLSGNGRTMAGELAARDNTDGAYIDYLKEYAPKYGFTSEQVGAMQHPRVSFVPDEKMPYTAETFAKFNQQEMKSQNKTEQAVKLGKTVSDDTFKSIVRTINGYDTLGDFYNDAQASLGAVYALHNAGVIPQAQLAEMVDGTSGNERLSTLGREMLENMLIGKAFDKNPDVVRMLTAIPSMRQSVITALSEISDNIALGNEWSLQDELADAVKLCFDARNSGSQFGEIVSVKARQGVLFADPDQLQTVADFHNATMMMLADVLNDRRVTMLKTTFALYNKDAREAAAGQMDLFTGDVPSKEDILRNVIRTINNGNKKAIEAARAAAVERRKAEGVQQNGTPPEGSGEGEEGHAPATNGHAPAGEGEPAPVGEEERRPGVHLTEEQAEDYIAKMEGNAEAPREIELTPENWDKEFGSDGIVNTPLGDVKMGEHQYLKLAREGRNGKLGMIKPTLEHPDIIIEEASEAKEGDTSERNSSYVFVKAFKKADGTRYYYFTSITVSKDGMEVVVSNQEKSRNRILRLMTEGNVVWRTPKDAAASSAEKQGLDYEQPNGAEAAAKGSGITPQSTPSAGKGSEKSASEQEKSEKTAENEPPSEGKPESGEPQQEQDVEPDTEETGAGYTITPTTYTTKRGKVLNLHLVKFDRELTKDEKAAAKEIAKEDKGWWSKEHGGWLMRSEEAARQLAETIAKGESAVADAQPLSLDDMAAASDQPQVAAADETIKVEPKAPTPVAETPQYDYDRENEVMDAVLADLRKQIEGGGIPSVRAIEKQIRDLRKRAKTIEDGMATADESTLSKANAALADLTGRRKAYEQFLEEVQKRMREAERDDALAAHGVKLGDKVTYKGKDATITDADDRQVTLDTGLAPVLYEVTDWENVELPNNSSAPTDIQAERFRENKKAPETATIAGNPTNNATVVSSAAGAKVQQNLKAAEESYRNLANRTRGFITNVSRALGLRQHEASQYGTFELPSGQRLTIRISNHNARVSNFDNNSEQEGISIVISSHRNKGISNDGKAHVVEFFYPKKSIENATGKPLADIIASIQQTLYTGEYHDTTGIAQRQEVNVPASKIGGTPNQANSPKQEKRKSKWVDDEDAERFEELRRRWRKKMGQANMGVDPERVAIGTEMAFYVIKHGARKFRDFCKQMIEALGESIRPYLKSFYNGARDLPEMADMEKELTPYEEVRAFDVQNFDKEGAKDIIATAEQVTREEAAEQEAAQAKDKLKAQRNEQRKEAEQQTAADTEIAASQATAVASETENQLPSARNEGEVNELGRRVDNALEQVNDQLAVLGYYEADTSDPSQFHESYGYMRTAEKKAVQNVSQLCKTLITELGIKHPEVVNAKGKRVNNVQANIAPAGGDVSMRITLDPDKGIELYIDFTLEPSDIHKGGDALALHNDLTLTNIMYRVENRNESGQGRYLTSNEYFPTDVTLQDMLKGIRRVAKQWLPQEDYVAMAKRIAAENTSEQEKKPAKGTKSKKKAVTSPKPMMPSLFDGLLDDDGQKDNENDTRATRQAKGTSRTHGQMGSVPADGNGVLGASGTRQADRQEPTGVSDTAEPVADEVRQGLPGQRSGGNASGGHNRPSEAAGGQPDGGRGIRNGEPAFGRNDDRAVAPTSASVSGTTGERAQGGRTGAASPTVRGERGQLGRGRGDVATRQPEPKFKRNYLYPENSSEIDNMTPQQRLQANVEALEVLRDLMIDGREATPEEREVLGRYRGWGGVDLGRAYSTYMMRESHKGRWGEDTTQSRLLSRLADVIDQLDPKGERGILSAINRAALTSYYTPTGIARAMNRFAELAGFRGGSMLDPSMGNGVFEGTMSKGVQQRTMIHGVELDWLTGQIARNLYPDADVKVMGYEDAGTADNAYDVVISNIPFGSISVNDKSWKHDSSPVRKAAQGKIHNYFAVKMLDNTKPGGLCVIMTSNAILDTKSNQIIRQHLADNAEILGVMRLPDNTFKGAGTQVVTDVIFLRKYKDTDDREAVRADEGYISGIEQPFLSSAEIELKNPSDGKKYKVAVNGYFAAHRDMMIGEPKAGGQYRSDEFGLGSSMSSDELAKAAQKLIEKKIVGDRKGKLFDTHKTQREVHQAVSEAYEGDGSYISSGNIVEQNGMFGVVTTVRGKYGDTSSTFNEMPSLNAKASRIRAMLPIRKAMKQIIDWQIKGKDEQSLSQARAELQKAYDAFVKKFGRLNDKANDFLTEDIDGYTLRSLENWKDDKFAGLSDIFTKNTIKPALDLTTAKTPQDAIGLSLAEYGEINPAFMEEVLGTSWAEQCGETLFRTPFTEDEYVTRDAYLSGDVKTKLEEAREAAKQDKAFERNVKALEAVQPEDIPFADINIRMGARWIPSEVYTDFLFDMFGIVKNEYRGNKSGVEYMPETDTFVINVASNELGGEADTWRTSRRSASEVFTAAMQDKTLSVSDTVKEDGKEKKVLNKEETELVNGKVQDLRNAFEDWLSRDPQREESLMRLYNDKFNRTVLRKFDGSHLNVAGLMGKELRPHQKDAVWMLINNRGGIVDHIVGAGKTLVMQSAIMEMRRMGIAKKPMIIALKSTVAQIAKEFSEAFPAARILAPTEADFEKKNRKKLLSKIALNDYDCVIISHDQYNQLPHLPEVERGVIDEQLAQLYNAIEYLYGQADKNQLTKKQIKGLETRKANLEAKLANLLDRKVDREFTFEGLGVDYLFVDECQYYKSLPYVSTYARVAGLGDKKGSQRAIAMLNGVRYLQKLHQGDRGVTFLSGTTISNSLSEIYHLLNYLRPSEMQRLGFTTFDAWAGNFAIHTAELEYGVTNELKEKDRFRSLTNIPELSKMYAEIADVRNDLNLKLPKPKMRSHIVTVPQSETMQEINREIVHMVKNKDGSYFGIASNDKTPWGLLASTLSAKAAINPRLIDDKLSDEGGKIPAVCENVKKIYDQFAEQKGTQLIFCDTGVAGKGKKYDAYSDIINRLVNDYGIPRKEIADIHEANTDEKRKALFAKVNDGSVRILIGGTKNMGTGVNVQRRIVAMHHVDVPWTPADREQREGRGVRQGNEIARDFNDDNVDVYFYATEGSLDMYKYQLQETKGKLFAQFKSGTIGDRSFDEGDAEGDFDPAEVVAMLSGNPVIFEKSKQDKKVEKLRRAKRAYESDWQRRKARFEDLTQKQYNYERLLSLNESDQRELQRGGFTADQEGKYPTAVTVQVKDDYASRRTFDKPKEAGAYIHELLKKGKIVQLSGFGKTATITTPITDKGLFGKPVAQIDSYGGIKYTVEVSDDDTAAGVAFRNLLAKVYSNHKVYERGLDEVKKQLVGADPGENKFPKQAELDEALQEKKRLDDEYKKLSDEQSKPTGSEDNAVYRIREDAPPVKTGIGYKAFVLKDGKLYPPMVANPGGEATPVGMWLDADAAPIAGVTKTGRQQVKSGGKGTQGGSGRLAYRPGWHLGTIPYALQFNRVNPETGRRELFPANFVWAEVEYAADKDYQDEAMSYGMNPSGKFQHSLAGLPRVPENGSYMYRTNPDPRTDPWIITDAMRVKRVLTPSEVDDIVRKAGREPQPRQEGAVTDEQINTLNAEIERTTQQDATLKRKEAEQLSAKLNTPMRIVEDVEDITHSNPEVQKQRRRAKGWYDTKTGEVVIVLPNNRDAEDVAATVFHETVAHKGLRELVGEENYDKFLDEVHDHLTDELKKEVDEKASKAFLHDVEDNGERAKSHEEHQRRETDELLGRMAEKPFDEMDGKERTLWQRIKEAVRRAIDKFLGSLKLPSWVRFGDNELRYMLWRSKERLERGKEHPIDVARDIVKRDELGLGDEAVYSSLDKAERSGMDVGERILDTFKKAVSGELKGKPVPIGKLTKEGRAYLESLSGVKMKEDVDFVLNPSDMVHIYKGHYGENEKDKGNNQPLTDEDIKNMAGVITHPDAIVYGTDTEGKNMFFFLQKYGDGTYNLAEVYGDRHGNLSAKSFYNTKKKGIGQRVNEIKNSLHTTSATGGEFLSSGAKIPKLFETKSFADENSSEDTALYRDPDETEDVWNDQSMGLDERITLAQLRLAANHKDDKTRRIDAMHAIGGNLTKLRQAMSLQRRFDMSTVKRVADLARVLMNSGYLSGLSQQEVKRLLAAVKNSVGHNDIEGSVQKVMDIMVDNQLKRAEDTLHRLETIKGSKVDARGVEVQGQLDPVGQRIMKVFKKTHSWEKTDIEEAIAEQMNRMGSDDAAVADEAAQEYAGLLLAREYAEKIKDSKTEERQLRDELKQMHDDASESDRQTESYRENVAILQDAIRQNKIERAEAYMELVGKLTDSLRESIANAQAFKEAEKQRIRDIQHNANSDMEGRPSDEHYHPTFAAKFVNNSFVQFYFSPLATFDQMLRMFGGKSANGEGYLYNRYMRGWVDARQKEIKGVREKYAILDRKAAELFGGKVKNWGKLIRYVGRLPKATVSFWNGGEMKEQEIGQGNLMYIYMVNKMLDGKMKLRKMGITEEDVEDIKQVLDPRLIELADWLQDEFLVQTRNEYNETHKRMFGASMAAVEHYFPLKILANARADKPEDLDNPGRNDGISTATGSIIKRRRNALALDITNADALNVILDHVAEMEHWNAFAELNRDLNTLRTYKRFRNQVQNMTTIYGSGAKLWKKFNDVCQMAAGTYRPPRVMLDTAATNFAKGVTAAKVSFRVFTALKQFLSAPAYIPEARADYLLADIINPVKAWNWCMKNLPIFNERWHSRMAGDPRLLKSDMDWKMWRSRIVQLASRAGMSPNAFIDALTVAIGAHSMYRTRLGQYLRDGYGQAEAERRANQDAEILYNQTQQSSEGAFTSTMQVDRSWLSIMFTVFRNASMAYQRQLHDALRNFKHNLSAGGRARSIAFMKKQLVRDGIDEATAEKSARRKFRRQLLKDTLRVATFGAILQFFWNLGPYVPYLLFGDDDDEKSKMWDDVWAHTLFGWLEGFTGGDVMSQGGEMLVTGEGNPAYLSKDMPLTSDLMNALQKFGNGQHMDAVNDIVNLVVQSGIGVNPQSITDVVLAIMDACGDDPGLAHEAAICVSRILQVPQSQIDKMYFDEVGLSGDEVSKYTPEQLAERYAKYKVKRGRFVAPWSWGDDERKSKYVDKANKTIKERVDEQTGKAVNEAYEQYEEVYKAMDKRVKAINADYKKMKIDSVEAARRYADLQKDKDYATYVQFGGMDGMLDKIAGLYLNAKTPEEAELCKRTLVGYKQGMVNVLNAKDDAARIEAAKALNTIMQDFTTKYTPMMQKAMATP